MAPHLAVYAHPFDLDALGANGGLARLRDLGFAEVALATSYHDGRWLMPWHPEGRVRFLEDGTVHFRPGRDYGRLRPQASSLVDVARPSPLERLCEAAPAAGLAVRAWTVGTHNSRLGALHPDLCVENAFGDRYPYALCPAQPAVQEYLHGLVADLGAHDGLGAIEFEAFGWMGWKHSSHHDKSSFTPRGLLDYALSVCFCPACCERMRADGSDPAAARAGARDLVRRHVELADAMAPARLPERIDDAGLAGLEPEVAAAAAALSAPYRARIGVLSTLGRALRQAMPGGLAAAVQVHPATLFTGSQMALPQTQGFRPDEYVLTAYGETPDGMRALLRGAATPRLDGPPPQQRLCIWPKPPSCASDEDLGRIRDLAAEHGITSIAIYHLGLLPWRTIERVARAFTA
ncbi:MAG: hypothetical protein KF830_08045 [Planctomycetes bacterium]|nr:hypothetical protein [Planctomycetota bacterium]